MYEIAILNPRRKSKARRKVRRARKGASKMAKRKQPAALRRYWAAKKRGTSKKRRRRAVKAKSVTRRRRRRGGGVKHYVSGAYKVGNGRVRRWKVNPRRRHSRRRSNPRFSVSGITSQLMPAAYGAAGGIALDVALGYIPLPAMLKTGYVKHATRIVGALGIGWAARKFLRGKGNAVAAGALTVAMYGLLKDVIVQFAPSVKGLGDYEEISIDSTADQLGAYLSGDDDRLPDGSAGVGAYLSGDPGQSFDVTDTSGAVLSGMEY
jgi:hypothetical protein